MKISTIAIATKSKKANSALMTVLNSLALTILAAIIYFMIFRTMLPVSVDPAVAMCQESAALVGSLQTPDVINVAPGTKSNYFSFRCPITTVNVKTSDLDTGVASENLKELGYKSDESRRYNLDGIMWTQASNCLQKVNFGVLPLFKRNKIFDDSPTYCVVCSVVSFDKDVKEEFSKNSLLDISPWMDNKTVRGWGYPVSQLMLNRETANTSSGNLWTSYNVKQTQALVYFRTQTSSLQRLFTKLAAANTQIDNSPNILPVVRYIPGATVGVMIMNNVFDVDNSALAQKDADGLLIVNYEKLGSLDGLCDIIGNEKYIESQV